MVRDSSRDPTHQVYSDLVSGLVDLRHDASTTRFDAELDTALDNGTVSPETAHRLRFWQRASVRAVDEHTRSVLPAALTALDTSRRDAQLAIDQMALMLGPDTQLTLAPGADDQGHQDDAPGDEPVGARDEAGPSDEPRDDEPRDEPSAEPAYSPGDESEPEASASAADTPGPASATIDLLASSLEGPHHRLIVADLVSVMPDVHKDRS